MAPASDLSLRGGQRPTWRPERAARGSALGVQSREGSHDFADSLPVIRLGTARLPRRFAPRNDTSGEREVHQCPPAVELLPTGRSLSAATDAIGRCVFIGTLYELEVPSRDCHVASLLAIITFFEHHDKRKCGILGAGISSMSFGPESSTRNLG